MFGIGMVNEKGGVGKTTAATTIAAGLAVRGKRVLLVDADAQGHATYACGLKQQPGLYDLLIREAEWSDVLKLIKPETYGPPGMTGRELDNGQLAVLPGNSETSLIAHKLDDVFLLADRIDQIKEHFDVVIYDTSPTPSLLHGVIYLATDALIYPVVCETYALHGLISTLRTREGFRRQRQNAFGRDITVAGIIPMMYRAQTAEHAANLAAMQEKFGGAVWRPVGQRIAWSEAAKFRQPVFSYAPHSDAAADAWEMVDKAQEVINRVTA